MSVVIKKMERAHKSEILKMMEVFYNSPAVFTNGSKEIFEADFEASVSDSPYLEGYVFETGKEVSGYAMIAKSFSTEFGKECIWIEDIYIKPSVRGKGIGKKFFAFLDEKYPEHLKRLEVEEDNETACNLYKKCGFDVLPYVEMKKQ
jgi:GNAT superfamily N-acetyltransferase